MHVDPSDWLVSTLWKDIFLLMIPLIPPIHTSEPFRDQQAMLAGFVGCSFAALLVEPK